LGWGFIPHPNLEFISKRWQIDEEGAAKCTYIQNNRSQETFVASEIYVGFKPLYKHQRYLGKKYSDFVFTSAKRHPIKKAYDRMSNQ